MNVNCFQHSFFFFGYRTAIERFCFKIAEILGCNCLKLLFNPFKKLCIINCFFTHRSHRSKVYGVFFWISGKKSGSKEKQKKKFEMFLLKKQKRKKKLVKNSTDGPIIFIVIYDQFCSSSSSINSPFDTQPLMSLAFFGKKAQKDVKQIYCLLKIICKNTLGEENFFFLYKTYIKRY